MHNLRRFTLLAGLFFCTASTTPDPQGASQVALPGQSGTEPLLNAGAAMREGAAIYADACAACHTAQGKGAAHVFLTLSDAPSVESRQADSLIRVVLQGAKRGAAMPAFGWVLSDAQVAAVVTYVRNSWGNVAPAVAADEVRGARDNLAESLAQGSGQGSGQ